MAKMRSVYPHGEALGAPIRSTTMAAFSSWSTTRSNTACGRSSPTFQPAGEWFTAKRTAPRVCTTSNRTGPTYGRRVCARGPQRAVVLTRYVLDRRSRMVLDHRALPLTRAQLTELDGQAPPLTRGQLTELDSRALPLMRGQLDIWLALETGRFGARWQLGYLLRIAGTVEPGLLERAIRQVVGEAEPLRAAFFQVDGQVFQKTVDYPDVELACYDLIGSQDPVQEAYRLASSIQRTVMPLSGPLFKFALLQTRVDEFYWFVCCHHIVVDGIGLALVIHRIVDVYNAMASGASIPPAFFGSLSDLIACELEYEASTDYLDDQAYWTKNLPSESEPRYRSVAAADGRDPYESSAPVEFESSAPVEFESSAPVEFESSAPVELDPVVVAGIRELSRALGVRRSS